MLATRLRTHPVAPKTVKILDILARDKSLPVGEKAMMTESPEVKGVIVSKGDEMDEPEVWNQESGQQHIGV